MSDYSFEYTHLADVDPSFTKLAPRVYKLQVAKVEAKPFDKTAEGGKKGTRLGFTFVVVDDEEFAGRKLFESFFENEFAFKTFRRISDATGVQQEPGQSIVDWATSLGTIQPTFRVPVQLVPDVDYKTKAPRAYKADGVTPDDKNTINWFNVMPA
jgi:hypothetical protein